MSTAMPAVGMTPYGRASTGHAIDQSGDGPTSSASGADAVGRAQPAAAPAVDYRRSALPHVIQKGNIMKYPRQIARLASLVRSAPGGLMTQPAALDDPVRRLDIESFGMPDADGSAQAVPAAALQVTAFTISCSEE